MITKVIAEELVLTEEYLYVFADDDPNCECNIKTIRGVCNKFISYTDLFQKMMHIKQQTTLDTFFTIFFTTFLMNNKILNIVLHFPNNVHSTIIPHTVAITFYGKNVLLHHSCY